MPLVKRAPAASKIDDEARAKPEFQKVMQSAKDSRFDWFLDLMENWPLITKQYDVAKSYYDKTFTLGARGRTLSAHMGQKGIPISELRGMWHDDKREWCKHLETAPTLPGFLNDNVHRLEVCYEVQEKFKRAMPYWGDESTVGKTKAGVAIVPNLIKGLAPLRPDQMDFPSMTVPNSDASVGGMVTRPGKQHTCGFMTLVPYINQMFFKAQPDVFPSKRTKGINIFA